MDQLPNQKHTPVTKSLLFALLALGVLAGAGIAYRLTVRADSDRESLRATELAFAAMVAKEGVQAAFEHFSAEDAVFFDVDPQRLRGRAALEARRESWRPTVGLRWEPANVEVAESGDLGFTWGPSEREVLQPDGTIKVYFGHYVSVWRRTDGGPWRLAFDTGNGHPHRPPETRGAPRRAP